MQNNEFSSAFSEQQINESQIKFIRKESSVWGFTAVLANIAITFVAVFISTIALTLGISLEGEIADLVMQAVLSVLMMTVPFILGATAKGVRIGSVISLKKVKLSLFLPLVMIGLGGGMLANDMTNTFVSLLQRFGLYPETAEFAIPSDFGGLLLFFFTVSVLPAIFEEFAYRGIVLGALRKYGNGFAIIASGLLFGLMHGNFVQIPVTIALGCVLGYINVIADSIWPSVTVHFLNNFMSCLQQLAVERCNEDIASAAVVLSIVAAMVLGIIGLLIISRKYKHPFAPIHETVGIRLKNAVIGFLSSPGTITAYFFFGGTAIVEMLLNRAGI